MSRGFLPAVFALAAVAVSAHADLPRTWVNQDIGWRTSPDVGNGWLIWHDYDTKEAKLFDVSRGTESVITGGAFSAWGDYFLQWEYPNGPSEKYNLVARNADTGATTTLMKDLEGQQGSYIGARISGNVASWFWWDNGQDVTRYYDLGTGFTRTLTGTFVNTDGKTFVGHETKAPANDQNIVAYDMLSGLSRTICSKAGIQQMPVVDGRYVVWEDYRAGWDKADIYGYDLLTDKEFAICTATGKQMYPTIAGDWVVWTDMRTGQGQIYGYDLVKKQEVLIAGTAIGHHGNVEASGNTIVWPYSYSYNTNQMVYLANLPKYVVNHGYELGGDLGTLGYDVSARLTGSVTIAGAPGDAANGALRMYDSAGEPVAVSLDIAGNEWLRVEFSYRFTTDGKLRIYADGLLLDTLLSPASGAGRSSYGMYDKTFNFQAVGLADGMIDLRFELVSIGDPELFIDNLRMSSPLAIPEPGILGLLVLAPLALMMRRRR